MKHLLLALGVMFFAAACGSRLQPIDLPDDAASQPKAPQSEDPSGAENLAVSAPTAMPNLSTTPVPIPTLPPSAVVYDEPAPTATAADVGIFATMPENIATGQLAPDFNARALDGQTFTLSASRGTYVLIFPTVIGCGDCVFTMGQLAAAYSDFQGPNLQLVLLNLYPEDVPETWSEYIDLYPHLDAVWSVVDGVDFVVDYEVRSLGTILLVDPQGTLVYRRNYPLVEEEFRQLFSLITG